MFVRRNSSSLSHLLTSIIGRYRRALDAKFSFFNGGHIVFLEVCEYSVQEIIIVIVVIRAIVACLPSAVTYLERYRVLVDSS